MNRFATILILSGALAIQTCDLAAQVRFGAKIGGNYVVGSVKIQPDPKDPPTNPKGLGMQFGAYMELPFSDMVGLRPELQFNFRRLKTEQTTTNDNYTEQTAQGTFTGKTTDKVETDQRLTYVQVVVPFMITPAEGVRVEIGPSFNFLLGGKENTDETFDYKGTINNQAVEGQNFTTSKKKGSAAVKDFRKMEICAVGGIGYTLDAGLDLDLRYYRGIVTNYDLSEGSSRFRAWTNMVEFSLGWTFGG